MALFTGIRSVSASVPADPRKWSDRAKYARWMMANMDWGTISTISTLKDMKGEPFSNVISFTDGFVNKTNGQPYFYVSDYDQTMADIKSHNFTTFTVRPVM